MAEIALKEHTVNIVLTGDPEVEGNLIGLYVIKIHPNSKIIEYKLCEDLDLIGGNRLVHPSVYKSWEVLEQYPMGMVFSDRIRNFKK